jgi:hypothetical protein
MVDSTTKKRFKEDEQTWKMMNLLMNILPKKMGVISMTTGIKKTSTCTLSHSA